MNINGQLDPDSRFFITQMYCIAKSLILCTRSRSIFLLLIRIKKSQINKVPQGSGSETLAREVLLEQVFLYTSVTTRKYKHNKTICILTNFQFDKILQTSKNLAEYITIGTLS